MVKLAVPLRAFEDAGAWEQLSDHFEVVFMNPVIAIGGPTQIGSPVGQLGTIADGWFLFEVRHSY